MTEAGKVTCAYCGVDLTDQTKHYAAVHPGQAVRLTVDYGVVSAD